MSDHTIITVIVLAVGSLLVTLARHLQFFRDDRTRVEMIGEKHNAVLRNETAVAQVTSSPTPDAAPNPDPTRLVLNRTVTKRLTATKWVHAHEFLPGCSQCGICRPGAAYCPRCGRPLATA